jgi:hypothetical protein
MITAQDIEDMLPELADLSPADESPAEKMQREIDEWFPNGI